jgi:outer membrane lipoprotein LolB
VSLRPSLRSAGCAIGLSALLLLSACAPLTPPPPDDTAVGLRWTQHRETLAQVLGFSLQGRLADGSGRSGELSWRQHADARFDLQLRGPFGAGAIAITGDATGVRVRNKDTEQYTDDPQGWMQAQLGWSLPLEDLRAWALGLPAAGDVDRLVLDAEGRLASLQQRGWTIRYDHYQRVGQFELPRRLDAESDQVRLRLVIDRWQALELASRS